MSDESALKKAKTSGGASPGHILIICAMAGEAVHLKQKLERTCELTDKLRASMGASQSALKAWPCTLGQVGDATVKVVECGIGLAQAAAATAVHICSERPQAVMNYGCAGAHRSDLQPGDCIVATQVRMMDSQHVYPEGKTDIQGDRNFEKEHASCDLKLITLAKRAALNVPLPRHPKADRNPKVHEGIVGSSETWCSDPQKLHQLAGLHCTSCEDMEAAAIASVCKRFAVPFICVKDISNNDLLKVTDESEIGHGMEDWVVSKESAAIVFEMLRLTEMDLAD